MKINSMRRQQMDNRTHRAAAKHIRTQVADFQAYLASPKFQGPCEDLISVHEVQARLRQMLDTLTAAEDHNMRRAAAERYEGRTCTVGCGTVAECRSLADSHSNLCPEHLADARRRGRLDALATPVDLDSEFSTVRPGDFRARW